MTHKIRWGEEYLGRTRVTVGYFPPRLDFINPNWGYERGQVDVTLTGHNVDAGNFNTPVRVNVTGGITATVLSINPTTLTARFQIPDNLTGQQQVTITSTHGTSNPLNFIATDRQPQITGISPSTIDAGTTTSVTIDGTDFGANPDIEISGGAGIQHSIVSRSDTRIVTNISVPVDTSANELSVTVISRGANGGGFLPGPPNTPPRSNPGTVQVRRITVSIANIGAVPKDGTVDVLVTVNPSPTNVDIKLNLSTISGTGQALFDNNTSSLTINQSSTVRIKGVTESSSVNNIRLMASAVFFSLATEDFTVVKLTLKEVAFGGGSFYKIQKDDATGAYTAPHWQDNSSSPDGDADDSGDRKYPVALLRKTKMTSRAEWIITPSGGLNGVTTTVKGDGPDNIDIPATTATVSDDKLTLPATEASNPFPDTIKIYDPLVIQWKASFNGSTDAAAGASQNQVYITRATPLVSELIHTMVHLSCKNADGQSDNTALITSQIWSEFTDLNVQRMDGLQMAYYRTYDCRNVTPKLLIKNGDGQCGSWAKLFIDLLKIQGIDQTDDYVIVEPNDGTSVEFMVKEWSFSEPGSTGNPDYPYLNIFREPFYLPTSYNFIYQEINDVDGILGQGAPSLTNPASLFGNHQIVKIGSVYYDPSYGVTYTSLANMDDVAIAGYNAVASGTIDEPAIDRDLNGDGDKTDLGVEVIARISKKNPAGNQLKETILNY